MYLILYLKVRFVNKILASKTLFGITAKFSYLFLVKLQYKGKIRKRRLIPKPPPLALRLPPAKIYILLSFSRSKNLSIVLLKTE